MKDKKKKLIVLIWFFFVIGMICFMDTDRYIRDNIVTIDKVDNIYIVTEDKIVSYPFDEKLIDLLSYGGFVVKVDNFFIELFAPYSNNLTKVDMIIRYIKGDSTVAIADVYESNKNPEEYILYMNNVYWTTNSKLEDLLELVE